MATTWFTPALFRFLSELAANNDRDWFQANRERWEGDVRDPMLAFILALGEPLAGLNRHFLADPRPSGGSMFRIFRDTRFARDKTPYKTNVGAQFRHVDCPRDAHAPGFYLHLEPGASFMGAGLWRPDPASLAKVRQRILANPRAWRAAKAGLEVQGDQLARVPAGVDPAHPLADDLRLKDFYTCTGLTQREICSAGFLEAFVANCQANLKLMKFLTQAVELPW